MLTRTMSGPKGKAMLISTMNDAPGHEATSATGGNGTKIWADGTAVVREPIG